MFLDTLRDQLDEITIGILTFSEPLIDGDTRIIAI